MSNESEFESRRAALIAEITEAFDGVSRKDGTTLHEAIAMDAWESVEKQRAARCLDLETRWQDVPDDDIIACCSALSFLNEKGFRYYIPAFIICGLRHWGNDRNGILHSSQYHLLHDYPKSLRKSEPTAIASKYQFTDVQSKAVARLLRFLIDFDEIVGNPATVEAVERWERYANIGE
ncbi:DUF6714 family protein [Calothrix sp. 336/3]|uniref:DUF6714 family protein n=1 Tax=Calothrix sp. 336/3 TaxID=1337936 RepID=UPI00069B3986|nr:DUF6714 family protein [Calothrix sp. 336/3]